ncbi:hypothetical protein DB345_07130 [Spartobacteria bacterium LR76]|nr:hypothetical protein DB345_07130 [Spartobacteria bacterium LR76]
MAAVHSAPAIFEKSFREHDRHCVIAAGMSLIGAWFSWLLFGTVYCGAVVLFETVRTGNPDLQRVSSAYWVAGAGGALILFVWASIDRFRRLYQPPPDRTIIGWHLFADVLLWPPRLTYAVADNMDLRTRADARMIGEAWRLLEVIVRRERAPRSVLAYDFPDEILLGKLLRALQLTGWIDLYRGEEDWYYRIRTDAENTLRSMNAPEQD